MHGNEDKRIMWLKQSWPVLNQSNLSHLFFYKCAHRSCLVVPSACSSFLLYVCVSESCESLSFLSPLLSLSHHPPLLHETSLSLPSHPTQRFSPFCFVIFISVVRQHFFVLLISPFSHQLPPFFTDTELLQYISPSSHSGPAICHLHDPLTNLSWTITWILVATLWATCWIWLFECCWPFNFAAKSCSVCGKSLTK